MKHRTTFPVLVLCLVALVCYMSCTVPAQPRRVFERVDATEVERFFEYFGQIRALPREALRREHRQREAAFAHDRSDENRLRLALLLGLPETDFGNQAYALELLQEYLNEPEPHHTQFRDLATLLYTCIQSNKQQRYVCLSPHTVAGRAAQHRTPTCWRSSNSVKNCRMNSRHKGLWRTVSASSFRKLSVIESANCSLSSSSVKNCRMKESRLKSCRIRLKKLKTSRKVS